MCSPQPALAAGITVFRPDPQPLVRLLRDIAPSVERVYVFINGEIDPQLAREIVEPGNVEVLSANVNLGVGAALNIIGLAAILAGFEKLLLFDQDSQIPEGLVTDMLAGWSTLGRSARLPAVLAPIQVAPHSATVWKRPTYHLTGQQIAPPSLQEVEFLPTSGSMVDLRCLRQAGWFRTDFFVDSIDIEWCFRVRAKGFSCWIMNEVELQHRVGDGVIAWPLLRFSMPAQAPFRMYCHFRNSIYGLRLPHMPRRWRLRQFCYLPFQALVFLVHHRFRWKVARLVAAGFADGIRGKLGAPKGLSKSLGGRDEVSV